MLEIIKKTFGFKTNQIWFADFPYETKGFDMVVFLDCKNKADVPGFICVEHATSIIDLGQDLDKIWSNMSKSSCRYEIRRAEKEGIEIKINQNFEDFIKIEKLFNKTKKRGASNASVEFMKKYGVLFIAKLGNEIMGGQFYLKDENIIRMLWAPSRRLNVDKKNSTLIGMGNRLMVWEAIKYAKAKGMKEFDLGGYYVGEDDKQKKSISEFKKSFGGKLTVRYIYKKDYSKIYKFLSYLRQKLN